MQKNKVISGDYLNKPVGQAGGKAYLVLGFGKILDLNHETVESYEMITEEQRKSVSSGLLRGAAGVVLLGPVGAVVGLTAKNKGTYLVVIKFKDGKNSLLEIDEKIFRTLTAVLYVFNTEEKIQAVEE